MGILSRWLEKRRAKRLQRDIETGRVLRGRQPSKNEPGGDIAAKSRPQPVMTVRVFRAATQTWEDVKVV